MIVCRKGAKAQRKALDNQQKKSLRLCACGENFLFRGSLADC
jgi:hypothetical protein